MTLDDFCQRLEALRFTDSGTRFAEAPELRSYDPPPRLCAVLSSLNVARSVCECSTKYWVMLQEAAGWDTRIIQGEPMRIRTEIGSAFGPMCFPMDEALLGAMVLDANQLLQWIDHYPICSVVMESVDEPGEKIPGVGTRRGLELTKTVN
jgi:hypothetical protein